MLASANGGYSEPVSVEIDPPPAAIPPYWSNAPDVAPADGEPDAAVSLAVTKGLYSVLLGDATLPNMSMVSATVFTHPDVRLRVWFNDGTHGFQLLTPDQRIAAVGYAMMADTAQIALTAQTAQTAGYAQTAQTVIDGAITAAKLADGAVGRNQLADGAVGSSQLSAAAVGRNQLASGAVGSTQLAAGAVGSNHLANGAAAANLQGGNLSISGTLTAGKLIGGVQTQAAGSNATVAGGQLSEARNTYSTVGGGYHNIVGGENATVAGGYSNMANFGNGTVGGGNANLVRLAATVAGGEYNTASGDNASIGGGWFNYASGTASSVGGGSTNNASGQYANIGGGFNNVASGVGTSVPGGQNNRAAGDHSSAMGYRAKATTHGSFVWADTTEEDFYPTANNQFSVRAAGGARFETAGAGATVDGSKVLTESASGNLLAVDAAQRVVVDPQGLNAGALSFAALAFGYGSGEGIASRRTAGANQYGLDFYTSRHPQLSITGAGDVGIGTNEPAAKLDVAGPIRTTVGIQFPDGSIQTSAAAGSTLPTTTSGYALGSTVSITLNGSPCSLVGPLIQTQEIVSLDGTYGPIRVTRGVHGQVSAQVQRVAPLGPSSWSNAFSKALRGIAANSPDMPSFALVMTVTQPGGASQSVTVSNLVIRSYELGGKNGQLLETAELTSIDSIPNAFLHSGNISSSTPSSAIPGITVIADGTELPGVTLDKLSYSFGMIDYFNGSVNPFEKLTKFGELEHCEMTLRANLTGGDGLSTMFAQGVHTIEVQRNGATLMGTFDAVGSDHQIRLADDGLPIEEIVIGYVIQTLRP